MSIRLDSKKIFLGFYLILCQHEDPNSTAVNIFDIFAAQRVNETEHFALNTFPLSVSLHYFICRLRPVTLSINSAVKQNTSPTPIN